MKRLEISRLMDEYTDTEVFPEGGSAADIAVVQARVLAQAAPAQKARMPRKKKALLAAALAAVLVVLIGAGFPYIQYGLANGILSFERIRDRTMITFINGTPIKLDGGRLYFYQVGSPRMDITDLVSEDTPYIYDGSDPGAGKSYYIILGGTPECYGYLEWIQTPYPFRDDANNFDADGNPITVAYEFELNTPNPDGSDNWQSFVGCANLCLDDPMNPPWLLAGLKQSGIPYWVPSEDEENVYVRAQS